MRRVLVLAVVAVALASGAFFFWTRQVPTPAGALTLHGNVDIRQVSLAFDGSGRIAEVRAEEGDHVQAGAVLATIDTRTVELQMDQATAQIEAQEQNLRRLRNGARAEEIEEARSRLATAEAEVARATDDLARLQGIAAKTEGRG